jgi:kynurenine 3-monooxygenase
LIMSEKPVIVVGAGLAGALLAAHMGRRGIPCVVYELREDLRRNPELSAGKSINLALSTRGKKALSAIGLEDEVCIANIAQLLFGRLFVLVCSPRLTHQRRHAVVFFLPTLVFSFFTREQIQSMCIPMYGRMLHDRESNTKVQYYSADKKHSIDSISRGGINCLLMDEAEKFPCVKFYFEHKCLGIDLDKVEATFRRPDGETITVAGQVIFGTDGLHSAVRAAMQRTPRFDFSIKHLQVGYKELEFTAAAKPEEAAEDGKFRVAKNYLHIWPRGPFMMIALPNMDGSFTVTCFFPHDGENGFEELDSASDDAIRDFFAREFPDGLPHLTNLLKDFRANKTSPLGTVKCEPWAVRGAAAVFGDAAHAVVPFFGQGMNASFEDVDVMMSILSEKRSSGDSQGAVVDWEPILREYATVRKANGDAIGDMAVENFNEMASKTADQAFLAGKHVEHWLENTFPGQYCSRYELVSFSNIPYSRAYQIGTVNRLILADLLDGLDTDAITSEDEAAKYIDRAKAAKLIETMLPKNILEDFDAPIPGLSKL